MPVAYEETLGMAHVYYLEPRVGKARHGRENTGPFNKATR